MAESTEQQLGPFGEPVYEGGIQTMGRRISLQRKALRELQGLMDRSNQQRRFKAENARRRKAEASAEKYRAWLVELAWAVDELLAVEAEAEYQVSARKVDDLRASQGFPWRKK